ncbi:MAG: hypothetical protein ABIN25_04415 [Ginsengibacter sp.]
MKLVQTPISYAWLFRQPGRIFKEIGQPVEYEKILPPPEMTSAATLKAIAEKFSQEVFPQVTWIKNN